MDEKNNFNLNYVAAGLLVIGLGVWHNNSNTYLSHNHFLRDRFSIKSLEYILDGIPNPYQSFYENIEREVVRQYIGNVGY